jgi:hypothetical protein
MDNKNLYKNLKLNFLLHYDVNTVRWLTGVQFVAVAVIFLCDFVCGSV